jgi:glycosyltransferase involved in cell wall biosynthesis
LPSASVVICTRDRPKNLERGLALFRLRSVQPAEIIVVDNASNGPQSRDVALAAGAIYVRGDRPGLDIARNSGAKRAGSRHGVAGYLSGLLFCLRNRCEETA